MIQLKNSAIKHYDKDKSLQGNQYYNEDSQEVNVNKLCIPQSKVEGTVIEALPNATFKVKLANEHDYTQMQRYSAYENYTEQSGNLPLVFATKSGGQMGVTMTGITFVDIPAEPVTNLTNWNKALDFSGSNEHAAQVGGGWYASPLKMGNLGTQVSANTDLTKTSNSNNCRAWATAIVFKSDRHNSNQHIWNAGEGTSSGHDNIFLRHPLTLHMKWHGEDLFIVNNHLKCCGCLLYTSDAADE